MDLIEAKRKRDGRLRKRLLELMNSARVTGIDGRLLGDLVNTGLPTSQQAEDDSHVMQLGHDLVNAGLARLADTRTKKTQSYSLDFQLYAITDMGTALLEKRVPPHPLVEDDRI